MVDVFKHEPGEDRLLGSVVSETNPGEEAIAVWGRNFRRAKAGWKIYGRARRTAPHDRLVCLRGRSPLYTVRSRVTE